MYVIVEGTKASGRSIGNAWKGKPKDTFRSAPIEPCENLGGARLMPYAV